MSNTATLVAGELIHGALRYLFRRGGGYYFDNSAKTLYLKLIPNITCTSSQRSDGHQRTDGRSKHVCIEQAHQVIIEPHNYFFYKGKKW